MADENKVTELEDGVEVELDEEIEIEVEDDTPPEDRGRTPSEPPSEVTEEELARYSDDVKKRIRHLTKGYHDERRAKEKAERERIAAEEYTRSLLEEVRKLKGTATQSQKSLLDSVKNTAEMELAQARARLKNAHEAGNTEEVLAATEAITEAKLKLDRARNIRLPAETYDTPPPRRTAAPAAATPSAKAVEWAERNPWFKTDQRMTGYALGVHQELAAKGTVIGSAEYYKELDDAMAQAFPDKFPDRQKPAPAARRQPVATVTRSTSPKKIKLTQTQIEIARRLGVPLTEYAKQVAIQNREK